MASGIIVGRGREPRPAAMRRADDVVLCMEDLRMQSPAGRESACGRNGKKKNSGDAI
jgi:hypothetical protein